MLGSETAEMNLRTVLFPCYLQLLGVDVGERDCGDKSADGAFAFWSCWSKMFGSETAEMNLRTVLFPCYLQVSGVDVGERDCGDESADGAVPMLFAAVGGRCWGARLRR